MDNQILDSQEEENKGKKLNKLSEAREFNKDLRVNSQKQLDSGKPKSEIFSHFVSKYGTRYQRKISKMVGFSISTEETIANKTIIQILMGLQIVTFIGQLLIGYTFYSAGSNWPGLFFSVGIMLWIDTLISRKLYQKRLEILPLISMVSILRLFRIYSDLDSFQYENWIYIYGLILITSLFVSLWLKRKLFPNFGFFGPKKGEFEKYKF